jgi:3',5'-cyclic AMP phosphodiesterase CpdA
MKLIQISDLHFVPPDLQLLGIDPRARLEACIADINRRHGDAAACLITGDLADRGAPAAYEVLKDCLAGLQVPYHLLIGNHDDRGAFRAAFPETPLDPQGFVQSVVELESRVLLLLDTHEPGAGAGSFCAARCQWLRERLSEAGERPVYIFLHHPPFDIGIPSLDNIRLRDAEAFAAALEGPADIRHLFFGHVHRPVTGGWRGIPFSALRATVHQVPLDLVTPRPVPYSLEPPAYALIFLEDDRTLVHFHDFLLEDSTLPQDTSRYAPAPS